MTAALLSGLLQLKAASRLTHSRSSSSVSPSSAMVAATAFLAWVLRAAEVAAARDASAPLARRAASRATMVLKLLGSSSLLSLLTDSARLRFACTGFSRGVVRGRGRYGSPEVSYCRLAGLGGGVCWGTISTGPLACPPIWAAALAHLCIAEVALVAADWTSALSLAALLVAASSVSCVVTVGVLGDGCCCAGLHPVHPYLRQSIFRQYGVTVLSCCWCCCCCCC